MAFSRKKLNYLAITSGERDVRQATANGADVEDFTTTSYEIIPCKNKKLSLSALYMGVF